MPMPMRSSDWKRSRAWVLVSISTLQFYIERNIWRGKGVSRYVLRKWRFWLPLIAVGWFCGVVWLEHTKWSSTQRPHRVEQFGCVTLYHNAEDRDADGRTGWSNSIVYDCWSS